MSHTPEKSLKCVVFSLNGPLCLLFYCAFILVFWSFISNFSIYFDVTRNFNVVLNSLSMMYSDIMLFSLNRNYLRTDGKIHL